jgi:hypothetical protein
MASIAKKKLKTSYERYKSTAMGTDHSATQGMSETQARCPKTRNGTALRRSFAPESAATFLGRYAQRRCNESPIKNKGHHPETPKPIKKKNFQISILLFARRGHGPTKTAWMHVSVCSWA